jgi:hypothetical protein
MPQNQRLLKLLILCFMPIGVIAGTGAIAGTFWYYFAGTKYLAASTSPSGHYRALITTERDRQDCGFSRAKFVTIERRTAFVKTGEMPLFCVSDDGAAGLSLRWSAPNELTIDCPQCENGTFRFYNGNWGDFSYRLEH